MFLKRKEISFFIKGAQKPTKQLTIGVDVSELRIYLTMLNVYADFLDIYIQKRGYPMSLLKLKAKLEVTIANLKDNDEVIFETNDYTNLTLFCKDLGFLEKCYIEYSS